MLGVIAREGNHLTRQQSDEAIAEFVTSPREGK
jgi:hypothetical protein